MGGGRGGESSNSERGQGGPLEPLGTRQNEEGKSSVLSLRINVTTPLLLTPFLMGKHLRGLGDPLDNVMRVKHSKDTSGYLRR